MGLRESAAGLVPFGHPGLRLLHLQVQQPIIASNPALQRCLLPGQFTLVIGVVLLHDQSAAGLVLIDRPFAPRPHFAHARISPPHDLVPEPFRLTVRILPRSSQPLLELCDTSVHVDPKLSLLRRHLRLQLRHALSDLRPRGAELISL
jgi:hypothetical protein